MISFSPLLQLSNFFFSEYFIMARSAQSKHSRRPQQIYVNIIQSLRAVHVFSRDACLKIRY